ncbi:MAG: DUF5681 domain-containing protein [Gallionella sp.]
MTTENKKRGRWKPGESGNPTGRTPGSGAVAKLRESIAQHLPAIITRLVTQARAGDAQAARLLLERVLPPMKAVEQAVSLTLPADAGLTAQGAAIVKAVADGALAPGQGAQLLTGLGSLARIREIDELEKRISLLEGLKNGND